jgi:hypothetical protein
MKGVVTLTEDLALQEGKSLKDMMLKYMRQGYMVWWRYSHPAVGITVVMLSPEEVQFQLKNHDLLQAILEQNSTRDEPDDPDDYTYSMTA